jgi:predicted DNA-binding transcriptional regulator AlpA
MRRRKAKSKPLAAESISPELATMIKLDIGAVSMALEPIVHTAAAEDARRRRALVSPTAADIEAVRQGDRAEALESLADRLSHGWVEAAWGEDPAVLPPWEVMTPQPWKLTGRRPEILIRLAAQANIAPDAMKREILKSAVIAAIHDDDRPVWRSVHWAIFGGESPENADQLVGRLKPGRIDEWDVYLEWFHRRALALANEFVDEESEAQSVRVPVGNELAQANARPLLPSSAEARGNPTLEVSQFVDLALEPIDRVPTTARPLTAECVAGQPRMTQVRVMRSLVAILVGEGPGRMKPVLASEAPRVVAVVREAIETEMVGIASDLRSTNASWAEKIWTCPPETRLGVRELAEAVGRPRSWVYRHASPRGDLAPMPHRRLDGLLVFTAGEVRDWLRANEEVR